MILSFEFRLWKVLEHMTKTLLWQISKDAFQKPCTSFTVLKNMILHLNAKCINTFTNMMNFEEDIKGRLSFLLFLLPSLPHLPLDLANLFSLYEYGVMSKSASTPDN